MTSIDELFKSSARPGSNKRKLDLPDPAESYKSAKLTTNGDVKGKGRPTVEDEEDEEEGPQLPPGDEEDFGPDEDEEGRFFGGGVDQGTRDALDYLDEQDKEPYVPEKIDLSWLRKLALSFEKRISKNAELRAKYEDEPQKFMGSEADLDTDIKQLSILTEHPEMYGEFAKLGCANSLVSLLSHENTDIAIDAIEMIAELTDDDVEAEQEQWDALVDAFLEADLLSLLVQNLERLDESNDADRNGVYQTLSVVENLSSQPTVCDKIGEVTALLKWLLSRIQVKESPVSQNKQYAAEILAILVQSSKPNRRRLTDLDAVDAVLQTLSAYRKRDPEKDSDEEEYAENLFDSLTCLVEEAAGKLKFVEAEGVELCLIMLREGKMSKPRALRILDHAAGYAGTRVEDSNAAPEDAGAAVAIKIVEAAGLKTLFGMFMKKQDNVTTEHLLGIFAGLLRALPGNSPERIRTLAKFVEKDYEKLDKVIALRRDYAGRVAAADAQIKRERAGLSAEEREDRAAEWLFRRLDAGLASLQMADTILAWLVAEDDGARKRIVERLAERDESLGDIRATLKEQLDGIEGDEGGEVMLKDMLETLLGFL